MMDGYYKIAPTKCIRYTWQKMALHKLSIAQHRSENGPSWPHHSLKLEGSNQMYQIHMAKMARQTPSIAQHKPEDGPSWPHQSLK